MKTFKGDAVELKFIEAGAEAFDVTSASIDEMYAGASTSNPFLLMLYDEGRVPYSQRVKREAFVNFYKELVNQLQVVGTFEAYLFVLRAVFGVESEVFFDSPDPGTLEITVNVANEFTFDFVAREIVAGIEVFSEMVTQDEEQLVFRGISGFSTDHDVELFFSELIPIGIIPTFAINFYDYSFFVADQSGTLYDVIDDDGNQIVFYEIGA